MEEKRRINLVFSPYSSNNISHVYVMTILTKKEKVHRIFIATLFPD